MSSLKGMAFSLGIVILTLIGCCNAFHDYENTALRLHNEYRVKHGNPTIRLDDELNKFAQQCAEDYARRRKIDHSCVKEDRVIGENMWATPNPGPKTKKRLVIDAIDEWYNEVKDYNFMSHNPKQSIDRFSQIVWKTTEKMGIGVVLDHEYTVVVAKYSPASAVVKTWKERRTESAEL